MIGPVTWLRNRRAVKKCLADDAFRAELDDADTDCAADLLVLEAVGADESFAEWLAALPDVDTDEVEHP